MSFGVNGFDVCVNRFDYGVKMIVRRFTEP